MEERDEKTESTTKGNKWWDKVMGSRLFAGLITGLLVYAGTIWVGAKEERSRTFDLLSNREVAANELQARVFEIYVQHIVPALEEKGNDHKKVALLAGLHSNFSEFFDTRPVFEAFAENVKNPTARHELTRLAKRVARRQSEFIKAHVDPTNEDTRSEKITLRPGGSQRLNIPGHSVSLRILGVRRYYETEHAKEHKDEKPALGDDGDQLIDDVSDFVRIEMQLTGKEPFTFELSYMDTPYMDNIWMRHSNGSHHQVALRLVDIDTENEEQHEVKIEILHFPGDVYAATQRLPVKELLDGGHKHEH